MIYKPNLNPCIHKTAIKQFQKYHKIQPYLNITFSKTSTSEEVDNLYTTSFKSSNKLSNRFSKWFTSLNCCHSTGSPLKLSLSVTTSGTTVSLSSMTTNIDKINIHIKLIKTQLLCIKIIKTKYCAIKS